MDGFPKLNFKQCKKLQVSDHSKQVAIVKTKELTTPILEVCAKSGSHFSSTLLALPRGNSTTFFKAGRERSGWLWYMATVVLHENECSLR
uniref:Uncharacterized protein n=1 Tax=Romanomermis culicivorax TaxID=13658 RepID=A0A915KS05_ROMCU